VTEKNTLITNQILYVYVYTRSNRYEFVPLWSGGKLFCGWDFIYKNFKFRI
jgi:hypothetical protein